MESYLETSHVTHFENYIWMSLVTHIESHTWKIKIGPLPLGRPAYSKGRSLHWRPAYRSRTRGSNIPIRPLCEGRYHPLRFGHRRCCFLTNLTGTATIPHTEAQPAYRLVELQLLHSSDREISYSSLSIWYCCLPFTQGILMHSNLAHLLLTSIFLHVWYGSLACATDIHSAAISVLFIYTCICINIYMCIFIYTDLLQCTHQQWFLMCMNMTRHVCRFTFLMQSKLLCHDSYSPAQNDQSKKAV